MTNPREIIAGALHLDEGTSELGHQFIAQCVIEALTSAGYHLLSDAELAASDNAVCDAVLDAAGDYMGVQYGNTALHHPTDRERIRSAIRAMQGGKP